MSTSVPQPADYVNLLADVKARIQAAQTRAVSAVNTEMMRLYWGIGRLLDERQGREGWGAAVIPRLARDLRHELPEVKGFSARNLDRMLAFARAYPEPGEFSPQAVAKTLGGPASPQPVAKSAADSLLWQLPWGHHALLLEKVKPVDVRCWYIAQALAQGWSRATLMSMLDSRAHERQGAGASNFAVRLLAPQSELVNQALKDPYVFDFLAIEEPFRERELVNFYCNLVDDQLKHTNDAPTIGLILCQRSDRVLAEYALRGLDKPIGVSTLELTRALPASLQSVLPTIDEIEAELSEKVGEPDAPHGAEGERNYPASAAQRFLSFAGTVRWCLPCRTADG